MNTLRTTLARGIAAICAMSALTVGLGLTPALAKNGGGGWQNVSTLSVPTGSSGHYFFSYNCPSGLVARSGGFFPNPTLQNSGITLDVNAPRFDESGTGGYQTWGFGYRIAGSAPAGSMIGFNVYCTKEPI